MADLAALLAQKESLERQIAEAQRTQRAEAIEQIRSLMSQYGLTAADLSMRASAPTSRASSRSGTKVPAKYRDAATGDSWSGRGLQPKWLKAALAAGKTLDDFKVS